jgi:hypothetical protein
MRLLPSISLAAVALLLPACGDDSEGPPPSQGPETVQVTATGFAPSAQGPGSFELWISFALGGLRHSAAASAGRFHVDASGNVVAESGGAMTFTIDPANELVPKESDGTVGWQLVEDAFVTWEPASDAEPDDPNLPAIVAGDFLNGSATLTSTGDDAFGDDFSSAAGSFHLATPTTITTADETGGAWFAAVGGGSETLVLPALPAGWSYEGWVALGSGTFSLGRFLVPRGADTDGDGPPVPGQDHAGYAFPGSDFPTGSSGVDLRPSTVFVSLEPPANADGPAPSFLRVLSVAVDAAQAPNTDVPLTNVTAFPSVTVSVPFGD